MVDPNMQGLTGVIHFIGKLTGAVDPHCLQFDEWQGMTPEERRKNDVSEAAMDKIRDDYNCEALYRPHPWQR